MTRQSDRILLTDATLVTLGEENQVRRGAAVLVEGDLIAEIGDSADLEARHADAARFDVRGKVLMPGNINAHDHLYSALARGISYKDPFPGTFVEILERLWWRLDRALTEEDVYVSGMLGYIEAVKRGTTTIVDHHASPGAIEGSLDVLARGAAEVGIRGCFCYEVTDRNGPDGARRGIEENVRFLKRCREERSPLLAGAFGLHASFTVGSETLARCLEAAPDRDTFFHVHVAEDRADVNHSFDHYGKPPLQRMLDEGLAAHPVLAAHCIHLTEAEFPLLTAHDVTVLHNPESNMNNAVGLAQVARMLASGAKVCLGTDGMTQDMFQGMGVLPLAHRLRAGSVRSFGWDGIQATAFRNNPALAERFFGRRLGVVAVGAAADLIVLDYDPPTPMDGGNFLGHLLFGLGKAPVETVLVGGRTVLHEGRVVNVDEAALMARARELAADLWRRW